MHAILQQLALPYLQLHLDAVYHIEQQGLMINLVLVEWLFPKLKTQKDSSQATEDASKFEYVTIHAN